MTWWRWSQILIATSAAILIVVATMHLRAVFFGPELRPRDRDLEARMKAASPGISTLTTMWKAWIGFNAIQSLGLMLFGLLYGYLSLFRLPWLRQAPFVLLVGGLYLAGVVVLARCYLFNVPLRVFASALVIYLAGSLPLAAAVVFPGAMALAFVPALSAVPVLAGVAGRPSRRYRDVGGPPWTDHHTPS